MIFQFIYDKHLLKLQNLKLNHYFQVKRYLLFNLLKNIFFFISYFIFNTLMIYKYFITFLSLIIFFFIIQIHFFLLISQEYNRSFFIFRSYEKCSKNFIKLIGLIHFVFSNLSCFGTSLFNDAVIDSEYILCEKKIG